MMRNLQPRNAHGLLCRVGWLQYLGPYAPSCIACLSYRLGSFLAPRLTPHLARKSAVTSKVTGLTISTGSFGPRGCLMGLVGLGGLSILRDEMATPNLFRWLCASDRHFDLSLGKGYPPENYAGQAGGGGVLPR